MDSRLSGFSKLAGRLTGRADQIERLPGLLQVDSSKIRRELDWIPPFALRKGLKQSAGGSINY